MSDTGNCPLTRRLTDDVETDSPGRADRICPDVANFLLACLKLGEEGRSCVNEMCSFLDRDERVNGLEIGHSTLILESCNDQNRSPQIECFATDRLAQGIV